jgi:hypothetical protein
MRFMHGGQSGRLAIFGVRGVEITRPKNFQVVKKTAQ